MIFSRKDHLGRCSPGEYAPGLDRHKRLTANLVCPSCKKALTISLEIHQIASDGTVTPSFVCTHEACAFHEMISLGNWHG